MTMENGVTPLDKDNLLHKLSDDTMFGNLTFSGAGIFLSGTNLKLPFGGSLDISDSIDPGGIASVRTGFADAGAPDDPHDHQLPNMGQLPSLYGTVQFAYIFGVAPLGSEPTGYTLLNIGTLNVLGPITASGLRVAPFFLPPTDIEFMNKRFLMWQVVPSDPEQSTVLINGTWQIEA